MQNLSYEKQIYWHENKKNTHIFISCYALSLSLKQRLGVTLSCVLITIIEYDSCGKGIICWLITLVVRVLSNYRVQLKRSPSCDLQVMSSGVANRLLGFLRRSAFETHDQRARKLLYLSLVRSNLAYCSQVWVPQAVILSLTSKEFSGAQQNSFCLCRFGLRLVISRGFWKLGYYHYVIGTNF